MTTLLGTAASRTWARLLPAHPMIRRLAVVTLVNTFGSGLSYPITVLYFTHALGLTPLQAGLGLSLGGVCGIVTSPLTGWCADRVGARPALVTLLAADAAGTFSYTLVHSYRIFLVLICLVMLVDRGAAGVRNALLAQAGGGDAIVHHRAYLRSVSNAGLGVGAALAALALQDGTTAAYRTAVWADAATFLAAAVAMAWPGLPGDDSPAAARTSRAPQAALTDRPYLALTVLNGIFSLQFGVLGVGIPLWVTEHTHSPRWVVSALLVLNTVTIVLFQVRMSKGCVAPLGAARACAWSGLLLAAACVLYGSAGSLAAFAAAAVVLGGGGIQTIAEMQSAAGGAALSYQLADPLAPGAYQGLYNSGAVAGSIASATLVTGVVVTHGLAGWLVLAVMFSIAGGASIPVTKWAMGTRERSTRGGRR